MKTDTLIAMSQLTQLRAVAVLARQASQKADSDFAIFMQAMANGIVERAHELSGVTRQQLDDIRGERIMKIEQSLYSQRSRLTGPVPTRVINKKVRVSVRYSVEINPGQYGRLGVATAHEAYAKVTAANGDDIYRGDKRSVVTEQEQATLDRFNGALRQAVNEHNAELAE